MKFQSFLLAATPTFVAAGASTTPANPTFGLIAIRSGDAVQYAGFNAALSSIFVNLPNQNASCARPNEIYATFSIQGGTLFLYDSASTTPQEMFVDRSGMGQGKIGYTTSNEPAPSKSERTGWAINSENHLQFAGKDLIACPNSIQAASSIWADVGIANPGFNENCVGIAARVIETSNPNSCLYTS